MTADVVLRGCRPTPLGSYLKAIGVLRLVATQVDPQVRGRWERDVFVLTTSLDADALVEFFLEKYEPTPIIAPWNGRAGFETDRERSGEKAVKIMEATTEQRFSSYRQSLGVARSVYNEACLAGWDTKKDKELWVKSCRSRLPDAALDWLDATVVLTTNGARFPPMVGGSGGVFGSMDLSVNFLQHLDCIFDLDETKTRRAKKAWLRDALFLEGNASRPRIGTGQFDPGGASLVNSWDYVLLIEGTLTFAGAAARRLGSEQGSKASMPFTVETSHVGYASGTEEEKSNGELWMPLWDGPASYQETSRLMSEGRAIWKGAQARSAVDMARAVHSLGVDRGITWFVRHSLVERDGQAMLAVPTGYVGTEERRETSALAELDGWVDRFRRAATRKDAPASVVMAARRIDTALFAASVEGGAVRLQRVLTAIGSSEFDLGYSPRFCNEAGIGPVNGLKPESWLGFIDDGTPELRLAAALIFQRDEWPKTNEELPSAWSVPTLLRPVRIEGRRYVWANGGAAIKGLSRRSITEVFADALVTRVRYVARTAKEDDAQIAAGVKSAFRFSIEPLDGDVELLASGRVDLTRLEQLITGLVVLDPASYVQRNFTWKDVPSPRVAPAPMWCLLAPFFAKTMPEVHDRKWDLRAESSWPSMLAAGHLEDLAHRALLRLRMARAVTVIGHDHASVRTLANSSPSARLLALALACPTGWAALRRALDQTIDPLKEPNE